MFNSTKKPLLHKHHSSYFSHYFYIFFFVGALIVCAILTHPASRDETAISGNELSGFDLGYESDEDPFHQRSPRPRPQNANPMSPPISPGLAESGRGSMAPQSIPPESQSLGAVIVPKRTASSPQPPTSPTIGNLQPDSPPPRANRPGESSNNPGGNFGAVIIPKKLASSPGPPTSPTVGDLQPVSFPLKPNRPGGGSAYPGGNFGTVIIPKNLASSPGPPTSPEYKGKLPHQKVPQAGSPKVSAPDLRLPNMGSSPAGKGPLRLPSMGSLSPSSSQAGPSGLPPPLPLPEQAPFQEPSPELSVVHVEDEGSHDEIVAPNADVQAPAPLSKGLPVQCNDPVNGFEAKLGSCGEYYFHSKSKPQYHSVRLTKRNHQILYLVSDATGLCEGSQCIERDMESCCKLPQKCNPGYITDVQGGCPANKVVNPYGGAFCKTFPCTAEDQNICCINQQGALFERTDMIRSNFARTSPDDKSPFAEPGISFGHHDIAWFDMSKKRTIGADEWAPLVNFMEFWKPGVGWQTEAWMKISNKGKQKYQPLPIKKMFPPKGVVPRAVDMNRVREHH